MIYKYTTWGIGEERGSKIQKLRDVFFLYKIRGNRKAGVRERERFRRERASERYDEACCADCAVAYPATAAVGSAVGYIRERERRRPGYAMVQQENVF